MSGIVRWPLHRPVSPGVDKLRGLQGSDGSPGVVSSAGAGCSCAASVAGALRQSSVANGHSRKTPSRIERNVQTPISVPVHHGKQGLPLLLSDGVLSSPADRDRLCVELAQCLSRCDTFGPVCQRFLRVGTGLIPYGQTNAGSRPGTAVRASADSLPRRAVTIHASYLQAVSPVTSSGSRLSPRWFQSSAIPCRHPIWWPRVVCGAAAAPSGGRGTVQALGARTSSIFGLGNNAVRRSVVLDRAKCTAAFWVELSHLAGVFWNEFP